MSVDPQAFPERDQPYEVVMKGQVIGQPGTAAIIVRHPTAGKVALAETYVAMMDGTVIGTIAEAVMQRVVPMIGAMLIEAGVLPAPEPPAPNIGVTTHTTDEKAPLEDVPTSA